MNGTTGAMVIQEVSPRDGLQIEPRWIETAEKVHLINALSLAGFSRIEAGSFVSAKAVPGLRDGTDVFAAIKLGLVRFMLHSSPIAKEQSAQRRHEPMR